MKISNFIAFLVLLISNFIYLYVGGLATNPGVKSDWYISLNQAPWTPPGLVFALAWTTIAFTFAIFGSKVWKTPLMIIMYFLSWFPNVAWNFAFFQFHNTGLALLTIISLTLLIGFMIYISNKLFRISTTIWLLPYFIWLLIATSLNLYICLAN